jgi:hypothetical protein
MMTGIITVGNKNNMTLRYNIYWLFIIYLCVAYYMTPSASHTMQRREKNWEDDIRNESPRFPSKIQSVERGWITKL